MTRMRGSFVILRRFTFARAVFVRSPSIFTTRLDVAAAAAPPSVVSPSYDAVVGTLLELHYYFNISKNHDDPKQPFTTSKLDTPDITGVSSNCGTPSIPNIRVLVA